MQPTQWCAALNIDSLSINPVTNQENNQACLSSIGVEPVNFAFITHNGIAQAPADPVHATTATYTPSGQDLFMNDGDHLQVSFTDTAHGLRVIIDDLTTGQSGSMTASAANGFGQVNFDPSGSTCTATPYDFHPMYSTSTRQTRVTWAAGSYNVAFDTEIGHFQFCNGPVPIPATPFGLDPAGNPTLCPTGDTEGEGPSARPSDPTLDDAYCFPASEATYYHVQGCTYTNIGFDGASYQPLWPDGNTALHPTPFRFSSPTTGWDYDQQYRQVGFETDLPPIESTCNTTTGAGCTLIPTQDNGQPVAFYPFYTSSSSRPDRYGASSWRHDEGGCLWEPGNNIPGEISNFGGIAEYGQLLALDYTDPGGSASYSYSDFRNILRNNPCPQSQGGGDR